MDAVSTSCLNLTFYSTQVPTYMFISKIKIHISRLLKVTGKQVTNLYMLCFSNLIYQQAIGFS